MTTISTDRINRQAVLELLDRLLRDNPATSANGKKGWDAAIINTRNQVLGLKGYAPPLHRTADGNSARNGAKKANQNLTSTMSRVLAWHQENDRWVDRAEIMAWGGSLGIDADRPNRRLLEAGLIITTNRTTDGKSVYMAATKATSFRHCVVCGWQSQPVGEHHCVKCQSNEQGRVASK